MRDALKGALRRVVLAALGIVQRYTAVRSAARLVLPYRVRTKLLRSAEQLLFPPKKPSSTPQYDASLAAFEQLLATAAPIRNDTSGRLVTCSGALYPGGAERQLVNTLCGLVQYGLRDRLILLVDRLTPNHRERYDFYLSTLQVAGIEAREIRRDPVGKDIQRALPPGMLAAISRLPLMTDIIQLYREFIEINPAVVHAWLDWSNVRAGLAAVLAGVPRIVLSGRNLNPSNFFFDTPYFLPAYQALAECCQVTFINNSEAGAQDYAQWMGVPRERIRVVRNGVDFDELARPSPQAVAALRAALGAVPGVPLVGGLFRFSPEKRPELWIETAALIARARQDCRFALFGTGPLRNDMVALGRKLGLGDRLTIGDVTREPLVALAAFDACLLTSSTEGTPNVALEAQWLGTPVVATAGGGTRESLNVGASGWLVGEPEPDAAAKVVLQVLSYPSLRASAAVHGPAFIKKRFGIDRMLRETLDLYGITAEPRRPITSNVPFQGSEAGIQ
jgi:glycosyltransferase involved in cell wall biosynthesis